MTMLIYQGGGFLPGVPARDLAEEDVKLYGGEHFLLATGLWKRQAARRGREGKDGRDQGTPQDPAWA